MMMKKRKKKEKKKRRSKALKIPPLDEKKQPKEVIFSKLMVRFTELGLEKERW
ncbi:conserved hypothetical protein [Ricinus communis]|uniref:Uncharacterized protein n=1 Tax=Ricinus communis TaxID=3988 RepID=B9RXM5_RICCO|nr:conserved hypothetical protein [Ricinus communis]